jgi:biotin--protein ligase
LHKDNGGANYAELIDAIVEDNDLRIKFMKMILRKLGLRVSETAVQLPSLSRIHLTSMDPPDVGHLVDRLEDIITVDKETSIHKILGGCDTIIVENAIIGTSSFSTTQMAEALSPPHDSEDYNKTVKYLQVHSSRLPDLKETPFFDHTFFYHSLATYRKTSNFGGSEFGTFMMYGETVTSTNTTLNKYVEFK